MDRKARLVLPVVLSALASWLFWGRGPGPTEPALPAATYVATPAAPPQPLRTATRGRPLRPVHVAPTSAAELPALTRAGASLDDDDDDELEHAHPITAQHEALRAQQQLVSALNDALDQHDAVGLRALIERYDVLAPEDPQRLAEGYERVADCLDAPDPSRLASARANGQRYYDDARASSLRRYVRRLCLEPIAATP